MTTNWYSSVVKKPEILILSVFLISIPITLTTKVFRYNYSSYYKQPYTEY